MTSGERSGASAVVELLLKCETIGELIGTWGGQEDSLVGDVSSDSQGLLANTEGCMRKVAGRTEVVLAAGFVSGLFGLPETADMGHVASTLLDCGLDKGLKCAESFVDPPMHEGVDLCFEETGEALRGGGRLVGVSSLGENGRSGKDISLLSPVRCRS
jgi:hypothetical protein